MEIGIGLLVFFVLWKLERLFRGPRQAAPPTWTAEDDLSRERTRDWK